MEERVPPAGNTAVKDNALTLISSASSLSDPSNLYVVQIPRDQVYRVPPPENAQYIAERSRNLPSNKSRRSYSPICWFLLALLLLAAIATAAVFIVRATLYKPKLPEFRVKAIKTRHLDHIGHPTTEKTLPPEYHVTLLANNPNERLSMAYDGGGKASLVFKGERIGNGEIPPNIKEEPKTSVDIAVVLYGKGINLPPAVTKSLNATTGEKQMQLRIEVPTEVNSWLRNQKMDLSIVCDFTVKSSLIESPSISVQECGVSS